MPDRARGRRDPRLGIGLALLAGVVAVVVAMLAGLAGDALVALARPPVLVRAALSGAAIVLGAWLLLTAIRRIDRSMRRPDGTSARQLSDGGLGTLVRGIRLVFLAAAAFSAAGGWLLGHPLPIVIALVIAGVDVVETSFLLLVATRR